MDINTINYIRDRATKTRKLHINTSTGRLTADPVNEDKLLDKIAYYKEKIKYYNELHDSGIFNFTCKHNKELAKVLLQIEPYYERNRANVKFRMALLKWEAPECATLLKDDMVFILTCTIGRNDKILYEPLTSIEYRKLMIDKMTSYLNDNLKALEHERDNYIFNVKFANDIEDSFKESNV